MANYLGIDESKKISKLQITQGKWQSGMTMQNHLATAFLTEPVVAETIGMVFGKKYPLTMLTSMMGKEVINNRQFRWHLMGDSEKVMPVTVAPTGSNFGIYNTTFEVGFAEKYFNHKDVLASDDRTLVYVTGEPRPEGTNWIYTLKLVSSDQASFIASTQVALNAQFSKEYTAIAENDEGGYTTSATPFMLENHLTTIAKSDSITRSAATDVMVLSLPDPENPKKTTNLWTRYREWIFMEQWYREQERLLMYSRFNSNAAGETLTFSDNSLPVYMGAGIQEQIEMGERRYYSTLTEEIILEFLTDLSYNRKDMGDRKFVALTGEYGMREFDRAMRNALKDWNISDASFTISGSNMDLSFGSQFKKYTGLNGMELTLVHYPLYDDTLIHRTLHPQTKKPTESYRFTVLDFGKVNGTSSNITKMVKKDSENLMWHVAGGFSPYGPAKSMDTMRAHAKDSYSVHALTECGVRITNPTSCGELIYSA